MRALKLFVFSLLSIGLMDKAYALSISYSPSPFQIQQGVSYTNLPFLTTYGASGPVTFSSSSMPSGLILNPDGTISGSTCVSNGNFSGLTARATDSVTSAAATIKFNVTTQPAGGRCASAITVVGTMPAATAGTAYNTSISASGGTGPYTYQLSSGSLPTGLSLSPSGAISGAPTSAGTYSFSVKVIDSTGAVSYQTFTIVVNSNAVSIVTTPSQTSQQGVNYIQSNTVSGGSGTYSYSTSSGALPSGTTLNSGDGGGVRDTDEYRPLFLYGNGYRDRWEWDISNNGYYRRGGYSVRPTVNCALCANGYVIWRDLCATESGSWWCRYLFVYKLRNTASGYLLESGNRPGFRHGGDPRFLHVYGNGH